MLLSMVEAAIISTPINFATYPRGASVPISDQGRWLLRQSALLCLLPFVPIAMPMVHPTYMTQG